MVIGEDVAADTDKLRHTQDVTLRETLFLYSVKGTISEVVLSFHDPPVVGEDPVGLGQDYSCQHQG